ncbi:MAG TPA: flagellar biosynthetic protein FliR [Aliidongia sp.]|uniref:flagellar biosynthetic protein FliR n=1 Tax=Aliidongia sp. TaxID=1914230 RepID=UPI002DDD578A|nr:flagellar biosynthetic protein FliR [Aliidongia sp.]HEV2674226.1 flagellar biosynthetic protein FliR [Aliidongia sp.]
MTTYQLEQLVPSVLWTFFLVFCRLAAAIGFMPGFGDAYVNVRSRLVLAASISIAVTPVIQADYGIPAEPQNLFRMFALMFDEIFIGSFLGLMARVLLASLETGGAIIAMQTSLASAITFNPGQTSPETLPASLLSAMAVVVIFATGIDHVLIRSIVDSYAAFPAGALPPFADMSQAMVRLVSRGFLISVELAAPFLVVGTVFHVAQGLISKIMPQLQVFYIGLPLQVMGGLVLIGLTLPPLLYWFLAQYVDVLTSITQPG